MRIGIDIQSTQTKMTGLGVYTKNFTEHLTQFADSRFNFVFLSHPTSRDLNTPQRLWWENIELPKLARREGLDLLHIPAFAAPWIPPCPMVVTVHDLIGRAYPNQLSWPSRFYWGRWLPASIRKARKIIADSQHTKLDILKYLKVPESKIAVINPSGHEGFSVRSEVVPLNRVKNDLKIYERYFLFVGTIEPRKNLSRTIQAFARFLKEKTVQDSFQLVIVGSKDFAHGKCYIRLLQNTGLEAQHLVFTGYLDTERLNRLYCGA
ncbi:MAG: glycosyltransferase family 4 protein, partial [Candidatus Omnitrophica bacterium]|nr:glycosyltransferase family 4 protein [Candidatus Omnitrophota bacterium]